jgi:hypothetical protein
MARRSGTIVLADAVATIARAAVEQIAQCIISAP